MANHGSDRAWADDWPQIHGPQRNGQSQELLASGWHDQAPQKIWTAPVGQGYAGPAIVAGRVLVFHRQDRVEQLDCLDLDSGELIWQANWPARFAGGVDPDQGPRCVPTVAGKQVIVFGADGDLHAVALEDGQKRWSRSLGQDYRAPDGYFGFGSSPIVTDKKIVVNVGGRNGAGIVALDADSGKTLWQSVDDEASYSAPISWPGGPTKNDLIFITRLNVVGLNAANGKPHFQLPFGRRGPTVNAAAPLLIGPNRLFLTASYGIGCQLIDLTTPTPKTLWQSNELLSSQYPTPIMVGKYLFGIHGREDGPPATLQCVNAESGQLAWQTPGYGMAHLIATPDAILSMKVGGTLEMFEPNSQNYTVLARRELSDSLVRTLPAFSSGRLLIKNTDGELSCWTIPTRPAN